MECVEVFLCSGCTKKSESNAFAQKDKEIKNKEEFEGWIGCDSCPKWCKASEINYKCEKCRAKENKRDYTSQKKLEREVTKLKAENIKLQDRINKKVEREMKGDFDMQTKQQQKLNEKLKKEQMKSENLQKLYEEQKIIIQNLEEDLDIIKAEKKEKN